MTLTTKERNLIIRALDEARQWNLQLASAYKHIPNAPEGEDARQLAKEYRLLKEKFRSNPRSK